LRWAYIGAPHQDISCIDSSGLTQYVHEPTHIAGHTLDLIITRSTEEFVSNVVTTSYLPSDHAAVKCVLDIDRPKPAKMKITMRKLRDIDIDAFRSDILNSSLFTSPASDLDTLVNQYDFVLRDLKDKHAPLITRTIRCRPNAPWYNDKLREMKHKLRRLERRWVSSKLEVDKLHFKEQSHDYNLAIKLAKQNYHKKTV
jgi:hypothetical protein